MAALSCDLGLWSCDQKLTFADFYLSAKYEDSTYNGVRVPVANVRQKKKNNNKKKRNDYKRVSGLWPRNPKYSCKAAMTGFENFVISLHINNEVTLDKYQKGDL